MLPRTHIRAHLTPNAFSEIQVNPVLASSQINKILSVGYTLLVLEILSQVIISYSYLPYVFISTLPRRHVTSRRRRNQSVIHFPNIATEGPTPNFI